MSVFDGTGRKAKDLIDRGWQPVWTNASRYFVARVCSASRSRKSRKSRRALLAWGRYRGDIAENGDGDGDPGRETRYSNSPERTRGSGWKPVSDDLGGIFLVPVSSSCYRQARYWPGCCAIRCQILISLPRRASCPTKGTSDVSTVSLRLSAP